MRKPTFFYCLVFFVTTSVLFAEGTKRTAVIEDSAGVTTEVSGLRFWGSFNRFGTQYYGHPFFDKITTEDKTCIAVNTKVFDVLILVDSLISIEVKRGSVTVVYQLRGQEKTLTGKLEKGDFHGESDFGDIKLSTDKLKKLTFKKPPVTKAQEKTTSFTATLVLTDGSRVPVANLHRCDRYHSTYHQYQSVRFLRGKTLSIVNFEKIKKITFQSDKNVMVTLKNGNTITGILSNQDGAEVECFTGTYEEGEFFISSNNVKAIEFGKLNGN